MASRWWWPSPPVPPTTTPLTTLPAASASPARPSAVDAIAVFVVGRVIEAPAALGRVDCPRELPALLPNLLADRLLATGATLELRASLVTVSLTIVRTVPAATAVRIGRTTRFTLVPPDAKLAAAAALAPPAGASAVGTAATSASSSSSSEPSLPGPGSEVDAPIGFAGQDAALARLRELCVVPFQHPALLAALGVALPGGVLLHGPPGVGKTHLVRVVAAEAAQAAEVAATAAGAAVCGPLVSLFAVNGPELLSAIPGETEARLRRLFDAVRAPPPAAPTAPSPSLSPPSTLHRLHILFFDEVDALFPRRSAAGPAAQARHQLQAGGHMDRVVTQFLTLLDGARTSITAAHAAASAAGADGAAPPPLPVRVLLIAATNRPDALDAALRRPGRLDTEIRLRIPDAAARLQLLRLYLSRLPLAIDVPAALPALADRLVGFVGADVVGLARQAASVALARTLRLAREETDVAHPAIGIADLEAALASVTASALRVRHLAVSAGAAAAAADPWACVGGMAPVIERLRAAIELPLAHPHMYRRMGISPPRGVLLYGPPGNSKTTLVRALATAVHAAFFALSGAEIVSAYVGEAERTVRSVFALARECAPCIIFLDEIDAVVGSRSMDGGGGERDTSTGILTTLLTEMDGVQSAEGVLVVAATNRPHVLDAALLRPGRLELHLAVPAPDEAGRLEVLQVHLRGVPTASEGAALRPVLASLAAATSGWSGAELANLCREAGMQALRRHVASLRGDDVERSAACDSGSELRVTDADLQAALTALRRHRRA